MRAAIIYYSYSGNTKSVAEDLGEYLRQRGSVELIEIKALDESDKFLKQCQRAFRHAEARIAPGVFDLKEYDLICFGSPVWAFGPAPGMNGYLKMAEGVKGKDAVLFTTYGSGTGNQRCLNYMQRVLMAKGSKNFKQFSVQQLKVKNKEFVLSKIREVV